MVDILIRNLENEEWFDKNQIEFSKQEQIKMSLDEIQKYAFLVNWRIITKNPNITKEFIIKNLDKNWDWHLLEKKNQNISLFDFSKNIFYKIHI